MYVPCCSDMLGQDRWIPDSLVCKEAASACLYHIEHNAPRKDFRFVFNGIVCFLRDFNYHSVRHMKVC